MIVAIRRSDTFSWYKKLIGKIFQVGKLEDVSEKKYKTIKGLYPVVSGDHEGKYIADKDVDVVQTKLVEVKTGRPRYWYQKKVGEVYEVKSNQENPDGKVLVVTGNFKNRYLYDEDVVNFNLAA